MAKKIYYHNGKKFYEIWTSRRNAQGDRLRKKTKFDESGHRIESKEVADRIEMQFKKETRKAFYSPIIWTWRRWHDHCLERIKKKFSKKTVDLYDRKLKNLLPLKWQEKNINQITRDDTLELVFHYLPNEKKVSKYCQRKTLIKINKIFDIAVSDKILQKNPAFGITVSVCQNKKIISSNDAKYLLSKAHKQKHPFYYHWAVALHTGMRNGELYALRWPDIDLDKNQIHITQHWTSKDGLHPVHLNSRRVVPISRELRKILLKLQRDGAFQENFFAGINNTRKYPVGHPRRGGVRVDNLVLPRLRQWRHGLQSKGLAAFCLETGLNEIKFCDLRKVFIVSKVEQGVPLVKVMATVGHVEMSTAKMYLKLAESRKKSIQVKGA